MQLLCLWQYKVDLVSCIVSGHFLPVFSAGRNEEETEKRLHAALLSGVSIISIDNFNGDLYGDALCQVIERAKLAIRPLGKSEVVEIDNKTILLGTGNNIRLIGDLTRRVMMCYLKVSAERPELRRFNS